jgi:hypothetical protein
MKVIKTNLLICLLSFSGMLPVISHAQLKNNGANIVQGTGSYIVLNNLSFENNGTFNQGAGTVVFTGNTDAEIRGTNPPLFFSLGVNNTGSTLRLLTPITIRQHLIFTNGLVDLNNRVLTLDVNGLLMNESETNHVVDATGGYVEITRPLNAPAAENPGQLGAIITSTQDLGTVTVRRGHQSQTNGAGAGASILRYYDISPSNNTGLNATLRFNYLDAELNGLNENLLTVWKRNGTGWVDLGRTGNNATLNFVDESAISDFTRFTLSIPGNALPLVWSSFNTQCLTDRVRISWKTQQEQNTSLFVIRRSADARTWTEVATLPAAGNSSVAVNYSWSDPQPLNGKSFYQVQQKDIDSRTTLSPVLLNDCGSEDGLKVFPNPVLSNGWVSMQSSSGGKVTMRLYDMKGRLLQQRQETLLAGNNQVELGMSRFANGVYSLVVTWPDGQVKVARVEKH